MLVVRLTIEIPPCCIACVLNMDIELTLTADQRPMSAYVRMYLVAQDATRQFK